jgi:5-methylcytosine-specific restriction enzyme B
LELIQFHPSYAYEDFFEGFRPAPSEDGAGVLYELTPGPLRRIAKAASEDPARPYVLIIDEINRGNIPKIFGELLFLLEYRDAKVPLQYSPEAQFGLPKNLYVIGTMNTADRSIALVDAALRRRFYFVPFMPRETPISDVLAQWLEANGHDAEPADLLAALNDRIANDEIAIGPSYFITRNGSYPNLERVWRHAIMPLLEEHYYGTGRNVQEEFGLESLRKSLAAPAEVTPVTEVQEQKLTAAE